MFDKHPDILGKMVKAFNENINSLSIWNSPNKGRGTRKTIENLVGGVIYLELNFATHLILSNPNPTSSKRKWKNRLTKRLQKKRKKKRKKKRAVRYVESELGLIIWSYLLSIYWFQKIMGVLQIQWWRLSISPANRNELFSLEMSWAWKPIDRERACWHSAGKRYLYCVFNRDIGRWNKAKGCVTKNKVWEYVHCPKNEQGRWISFVLEIENRCNGEGF